MGVRSIKVRIMFRSLVVALCLASASAYVPTAMPASKLASSKFVGERPSFAVPAEGRSSEVSMSAVTERDADGNPVTHYEMFDVFWLGVVLTPWLALLVTNPFYIVRSTSGSGGVTQHGSP